MKIWSEIEIEYYIKTNESFILKCLEKLNYHDLLDLNNLVKNIYDYYKYNFTITDKQLSAIRNIFLKENFIAIFTLIANNPEIEINKEWFVEDTYDKNDFDSNNENNWTFDMSDYF